MNSLFCKLTSNFKIDLDLEKMLLQFGPEVLVKPSDGAGHVITADKDQQVFWQTYLNGTSFARGFRFTFPNETTEIIDQIRILQSQVSEIDSPLIKKFKEAVIRPNDLFLLRVKRDADPHIDGNRSLALNIGLKNSSSRETIISNDTNIKKFWSSNLHSFTMEDGDAYLINTTHPHAVKSSAKENWDNPRYLISYSIK
jgi:hypothetical protein